MTEETAEAVEPPSPPRKPPGAEKGQKEKSREAEALEKCEAEKKELEDRYLRLMAEYDNYRRRTQKERENVYPDAVANTLKELRRCWITSSGRWIPPVPMKIISPASR